MARASGVFEIQDCFQGLQRGEGGVSAPHAGSGRRQPNGDISSPGQCSPGTPAPLAQHAVSTPALLSTDTAPVVSCVGHNYHPLSVSESDDSRSLT